MISLKVNWRSALADETTYEDMSLCSYNFQIHLFVEKIR